MPEMMQHMISDAQLLCSRLKSHDGVADKLITKAQALSKQIDAMKQYEEEAVVLNETAHQKPRDALVQSIQQENIHLRELQQENKELSHSLEEHQNTLELIMSKYRSQVGQLIKMQLPGISGDSHQTQQLSSMELPVVTQYSRKVQEMAAVMKRAADADQQSDSFYRQQLAQLRSENQGLRELLHISRQHSSGSVYSAASASTIIRSMPPAATQQTSGPTVTATQDPAAVTATQNPSATITTADPSAVITTHDPTAAITTQDPAAAITTHDREAAITTHDPTAAITTQDPAAAITTHDREAAITTQGPAAGITTQDPAAAITTQDPAAGITTKDPVAVTATQHPFAVTTTRNAVAVEVKTEMHDISRSQQALIVEEDVEELTADVEVSRVGHPSVGAGSAGGFPVLMESGQLQEALQRSDVPTGHLADSAAALTADDSVSVHCPVSGSHGLPRSHSDPVSAGVAGPTQQDAVDPALLSNLRNQMCAMSLERRRSRERLNDSDT